MANSEELDAAFDRMDKQAFCGANVIRDRTGMTPRGELATIVLPPLVEFTPEEEADLIRQAKLIGHVSPFVRGDNFATRPGNQTVQGSFDLRIGKGASKVAMQSDEAPAHIRFSPYDD